MEKNRKEQSEKGFLMEKQIRLVHVVFGMPSLNCRRYGLCRIEDRSEIPLEKEDIRRQPNTALAYMYIYPTGVSFRFLNDTMTERDKQKFFGNGSFLIQEDKPLSKRLSAHFGIQGAIILRGQYRIKKTALDCVINAKFLFIAEIKPIQINNSKAA